jgi:hypothetical protein
MNEDIFRELQFWCFHCNVLSFKSIVPMYRQPQRVIFTDASQFAGAGFTVGDNKIVHFMCNISMKNGSNVIIHI